MIGAVKTIAWMVSFLGLLAFLFGMGWLAIDTVQKCQIAQMERWKKDAAAAPRPVP